MSTLLKRQGNKSKIAKNILSYFPKHDIFIETCLGAGGIYFNKPKAKYNILNDLDDDVFNLFNLIKNDAELFKTEFEKVPLNHSLFDFWVKNEEVTPLSKALRFLYLSNFSLYGGMETFKIDCRDNMKRLTLQRINEALLYLSNAVISCKDFEVFLKNIHFNSQRDKTKTFVYNDPPYLGTGNNYKNGFKVEDTERLIKANIAFNSKFAISEFDNPIVIEMAKDYNLFVFDIGERRNIKNRRKEILITNYSVEQFIQPTLL
ncbi:DNA adenine methylase [Bernardetia sp. Wsw4-3y2]|uniref:DNA adenine methylase n=1 Tax=Bernardetia sp. Wsw4-3y2 TaxID=3127471 RepID=UPI0030CC6945